ncbi:hypothetical protein VDGD_20468 [Verticillium dahliae]|nr:hypothetical protein VDGD_20468 [Verticillium dahliae]
MALFESTSPPAIWRWTQMPRTLAAAVPDRGNGIGNAISICQQPSLSHALVVAQSTAKNAPSFQRATG